MLKYHNIEREVFRVFHQPNVVDGSNRERQNFEPLMQVYVHFAFYRHVTFLKQLAKSMARCSFLSVNYLAMRQFCQ